MIKKIILAISITLVISCKKTNTNTKIAELEKIIEKEKIRSSTKERQNERLKNTIENLRDKITENKETKENRNSIIAESIDILTDKKIMIQNLFNSFDLDNSDASRGIATSYFLQSYDGFSDFDTKNEYYSYITSKIDRSPENLKKIFTPQVKKNIYKLFKNNKIYKNSGAEALLKASLIIYNDTGQDAYISREIYSLASQDNYNEVEDYISSTIDDSILKELKTILKYENYSNYEKVTELTTEDRLTYLYTFWARRYNEGNAAYVYELLKEFHNNVTTEQPGPEELDVDELNLENLAN
ncbi:hypothetical protein [Cellulophaga omnivescoria]|uniref:hypothetical protein n=1 Tax=Cellulophaga omnivescoria TaxID=1888890 RepID=UPI0022F0D474|nr:hypothetical protein [Cellulophaga omnivescoria]WBU89357.1 hypothetical protein PBN93_15980 [Cellulophaga omnivescoria]WKB81381.1 hypothetical protein QYR09_16725 [Cellulophaga lytica]